MLISRKIVNIAITSTYYPLHYQSLAKISIYLYIIHYIYISPTSCHFRPEGSGRSLVFFYIFVLGAGLEHGADLAMRLFVLVVAGERQSVSVLEVKGGQFEATLLPLSQTY